MSQHYGWFEAFKNEDGTVSAAIPKEWPQDVKDNFNKSVDLWIARGAEIERQRIIKLLKDKARSLKQIAESIAQDEYMNADDSDYPYWGALALDDFADALIKGENK